ncbi:MAG TPA: hypothetical protein VNI20_04520 [Fimbriimonadaceae bacterium]|nr:hypothetical protein [Fimbriimonadaceae bacterium]
MATAIYRPPDLLHWFSSGSQEAIESAKRKGRALTKEAGESSIRQNIMRAASVAAEFGRGAAADMVHKHSAESVYRLLEDRLVVQNPISQDSILYSEIESIEAAGKDKFKVGHSGGTLTIRPLAHLVSGRIRVPVGWLRNEIEVPYTMLIEEISARSGVEIDSA